ncbi:DUF2723 domain-containing protein [Flavobacteriaceae bacterium S0825]|uniref:glycosyltransferase family 117 protein n=1 Tax=Gaetbulibacter sp. S0825 TaxID=2720084 RepID=UPI001431D493|nr:DUF2723 domain-containing protein [Gaetbulibacter sp. S0825]MCK0108474.1 DUF2723 domain-containing protein [Flavobacteriaceae bacterium S0825]NIX64110.1 DUF2723 domain-containing protein [Gaetbulibacter sp. S0825]
MTQNNFKKWNTILGWTTFLIAFITYSLTVEPTVSYWDAGEYILTSSKLQVGHPPGAPFFQMLGAFFSIFAMESSQVGLMLNMMSAAASAFTIAFMFWSISMLLQKVVVKSETISLSQGQAILGASLVGSIAFTFTDSFWYNAVETEVYAMATMIMALMFYLGLRWERDMHKPRGNKWLVLISFIVGLSFGVHFMGLLTIPAIGLIYFFKNYKTITVKNFIVANVVVVAILLFIFKLLAPNILRFFSALEIFFVNSIGLPFNSGSIIAGLLIVAAIYYGLNYTRKKQYKHINTGIFCLTFVILGFSTWLMLPIRANANVVINENNPSSARELLAYYNLEQYPKTYLFYGPQFTDQYAYLDENNPYGDDKPKYEKDLEKGKYVIVNDYINAKQNYNSEHASLLPRMWSGEHAENYMMYTGFLNFKIKPDYQMNNEVRSIVNEFRSRVQNGEIDYEQYHNFLRQYGGQLLDIEKPSLLNNVAYMLEYQLGYMYWRYFMWNFTGRQDDIQGKYDMHGNWISGINFIDEIHLGLPQDNLPSDVLNNKGRNTYYFLPLILGLIGLFFMFNSDKKLFWVMLVFFLFTGLAIQVYTNVRPFEPRERDYSVVGSFYVFAIWIGFGAYALYDFLSKFAKHKLLAPAVTLVCLVLVPGILAANNWDDHDRSGKKTALSMARKYLESCAPNAILFSIGDNDSFPLWYIQEIEGVRTDVRVVNTSLFQTDWYIDQMKRKAYESDPIPSQLTHDQYKYGTRDALSVEQMLPDSVSLDIKEALNFITSDNERAKFKYVAQQKGYDLNAMRRQDLEANYLPTRHLRVPVDKESVLKHGIVKPKDADEIVPYIDLTITDNALYKNRLLMLDIVANNNWERPIYFTGGAFGDDDYIWMKDYLQLDGLCYKLVPIKTPVDRANPFDMGRVDPDLMYEQVKNWDWGNSGEGIYHDVETRKNGISYRGNIARLVESLINEDELDKAEEMTDLAMEKMPVDEFGFYTLLEPFISAYYEVEANDKGRQLYKDVSMKYQESLTYFSALSQEKQTQYIDEISTDIARYRGLIDVLMRYEEQSFVEAEMQKYNNFIRLFTGETEEFDSQDADIPRDTTIVPIDSTE